MSIKNLNTSSLNTILIVCVLIPLIFLLIKASFPGDRTASPAEIRLAETVCDTNSSMRSYDANKFIVRCEDGSGADMRDTVLLAERIAKDWPNFLDDRAQYAESINEVIHILRDRVGCEQRDAECLGKLKAAELEGQQ